MDVTPIAIREKQPRRVQARPTPFVVPKGPYLAVSPDAGPPVARTIAVSGGRLPASSAIQLIWAPLGKHSSAVSRTAYTDARGNFSTRFTIPGSPPGIYQIVANTNFYQYAAARYVVKSAAGLSVRITSAGKDEQVRVRGRQFIPHLKLLLIAYPLFSGGNSVLLGNAQADGKGSFTYSVVTPSLHTGEYFLRAWSADALAAQMAEAYFQVVI